MVAEGKLIVLNKFSTVETRVTFLIEAIRKIDVDVTLLDDRRKTFLKEVLAFKLNEETEKQEAQVEQEVQDVNISGEHEEAGH